MIDILPIRFCDVEACRKIVIANWDMHVANRFMREVSNVFAQDIDPAPIYYVAEVDGTIAGFAGMAESWRMKGFWDFTWINVRKDYRNQGIGRKLVEYRVNEIRRSNGSVIQLITKEPTFFEQFGFSGIRDYGKWQLMEMVLGTVDL